MEIKLYDNGDCIWCGTLQSLLLANQDDPMPDTIIDSIKRLSPGEAMTIVLGAHGEFVVEHDPATWIVVKTTEHRGFDRWERVYIFENDDKLDAFLLEAELANDPMDIRTIAAGLTKEEAQTYLH